MFSLEISKVDLGDGEYFYNSSINRAHPKFSLSLNDGCLKKGHLSTGTYTSTVDRIRIRQHESNGPEAEIEFFVEKFGTRFCCTLTSFGDPGFFTMQFEISPDEFESLRGCLAEWEKQVLG